jgi:hypothetical protein
MRVDQYGGTANHLSDVGIAASMDCQARCIRDWLAE